ncbi:MAG: DUF3786 domain-containing protein [Desulfobacterales bacterium]|jgi:hypothetical protein|nr:DUF3786 domain-containing protein [Desulfobacterales bacterium]
MEKAPIFEKVYRDYLDQVSGLNLAGKAELLGISIEEDGIRVPVFRREYHVTPAGIMDADKNQPLHAISVLLCRYLILCPEREPANGREWVSYKDFMNATPFVSGFVNNTEKAIAKHFSGKLIALEDACLKLGGIQVSDGLSYDLSIQVSCLPKIPLYLLFNDADDEFPAECRVLFERRAEQYLDMECLAISGWLLTDYLMQISGKDRTTIM